ncbi:hypothetical protein [Spiroplasma alleghenense]|uniref:Uncharacterized protein n=1 Tax=Spiroplasma alleghenense TaxID=216931 RepID=A0A345Z2D6_9MOLU|nr:hypothetical protein [Spiroplasma alleghenense]AXK50765.1 hypothetical protein SALLE_v1c00890 [Spiroplasma alleghenense]
MIDQIKKSSFELLNEFESQVFTDVELEKNKKFEIKFKAFKGEDFNVDKNHIEKTCDSNRGLYQLHRLYVNSSNNPTLPNRDEYWDDVYFKAKKNKVYHKTINIIYKHNVLEDSSSKKEFLKNNKYFGIEFEMGYNFRYGKKHWTSPEGLDIRLEKYEEFVELTSFDKVEEIATFSDPKHDNKERVTVGIELFWVGNELNIFLKLYASVNWTGGSVYNHLAIIGTQNERILFYSKLKTRKKFDQLIKFGNVATPIKDKLKVDLASDSVHSLINSIKSNTKEGGFDTGKMVSLEAHFSGPLMNEKNKIIGLSGINIGPGHFVNVVRAVNKKIKSGKEFDFKLELKFSVWLNNFQGILYLKLDDNSYKIGASNVEKWKNGYWVSYQSSYISHNLYVGKVK